MTTTARPDLALERTWWPSKWHPQEWTDADTAEAVAAASAPELPGFVARHLPVHRQDVMDALFDRPELTADVKAALRRGLGSLNYTPWDAADAQRLAVNVARASFLSTQALVAVLAKATIPRGGGEQFVATVSAHRRFTPAVAGALIDAALGGDEHNKRCVTRQELIDAVGTLGGMWPAFAALFSDANAHAWTAYASGGPKMADVGRWMTGAGSAELEHVRRLVRTCKAPVQFHRLAAVAMRDVPASRRRQFRGSLLSMVPFDHIVTSADLPAYVHAASQVHRMAEWEGVAALRALPVGEEAVFLALARSPHRPLWLGVRLCKAATDVNYLTLAAERLERDGGHYGYRLPYDERAGAVASLVADAALPPVRSLRVWEAIGGSAAASTQALTVAAARTGPAQVAACLTGMSPAAWRAKAALAAALDTDLPAWVHAMARLALSEGRAPAGVPGPSVGGVPLVKFVSALGPCAAQLPAWEAVAEMTSLPGAQVAAAVRATFA